MTKIVIAGAGLGGLYTAIQLIHKGISPDNITLVDPRAGRYTRPGHLNSPTFSLVSKNTGIATPHSPANHIKELERSMLLVLVAQGAHFVAETFVDLQQQTNSQVKAAITLKKDRSQTIHPADFVFDCTGKEARVAAAVNAVQQKKGLPPAFKSESLVRVNPISDHLVAQVKIIGEQHLKGYIGSEAVPPKIKELTPEQIIDTKERLLAFGWAYEAFPTFYSFPEGKNNKICLYMETPANLVKSQQGDWIKLLLSIYSNGQVTDYRELAPSQKYREKPRIVAFKSNPHVLNTIVFQEPSLPQVIVGFDALKGFDYRIANGVVSGMLCCDMTLNNIAVRNGVIIGVDVPAIHKIVFEYINSTFKTSLNKELEDRSDAIHHGYEFFSKNYLLAAEQMAPTAANKKSDYKKKAGLIAYQGAMVHFALLNSKTQSSEKLEVLNKCLTLLIRASENSAHLAVSAQQEIQIKLKLIHKYMQVTIEGLDIELILNTNDLATLDKYKKLFSSIEENYKRLPDTAEHMQVISKMSEFAAKIREKELELQSHVAPNPLAFLLNNLLFGTTRATAPGTFFVQRSQQSPADLILALALGGILTDLNDNQANSSPIIRFN